MSDKQIHVKPPQGGADAPAGEVGEREVCPGDPRPAWQTTNAAPVMQIRGRAILVVAVVVATRN